MMEAIVHPWPAVFDKHSQILILGTMPSPASRRFGYYGHPQNIFWPTLAKVLNQEPPEANQLARQRFLLANHIALWDVIYSCEIDGAKDATICNVVPNDFREIFTMADIKQIFATGRRATDLFNELCATKVGMKAIYLPSTSPANRFRQMQPEYWKAWQQVANALKV